MKKASATITIVLTVITLFCTASFYFYKNSGGSPLHIRELAPTGTSEMQATQAEPATERLVNINTANADQLATLPGIGQVLAQRIIDYRNENGPFDSPAGLLNVSGIGEKKLEAILDLITTGGST